MKKAILAVLVFIIMQVVVPIVATYILGVIGISNDAEDQVSGNIMNPYVLSVMLLAIYALTIGALYSWKLLLPATGLTRHKPLVPLAVVIMLLVLVPLSYFEEILNLPDALSANMGGLMHNALGIFCVAIAGPVVEEYVFRRAVLGSLLEANYGKVAAVVISAVAFALIHFNPAQMPAAFIIGCLFGWLYIRTGSIIPSTVCHIVNNSLCVVTALSLPADSTLSKLLGGTAPTVITAVLCLGIALLLIRIYNSKTAPNTEK